MLIGSVIILAIIGYLLKQLGILGLCFNSMKALAKDKEDNTTRKGVLTSLFGVLGASSAPSRDSDQNGKKKKKKKKRKKSHQLDGSNLEKSKLNLS